MHTVIGAFDDTTAAQRAVERLVQAGIDREDVHVQPQSGGAGGQGQQMVGGQQEDLRSVSNTWDKDRAESRSSGGFFARLFGMDDQVDNRQQAPQASQSDHSEHFHTYNEAVNRGNAVVVVDAESEAQADRACTVLQECGAYDVNERSKQWQADGWKPPVVGGTRQNLAAGTRDDLADNQQGTIDVVEEQLQVGKRTVDRGGVRVIQRVSQKPVRELVRLREEHVVVDRHPVDRPATGQDLSNFREGTLEVHEQSEEAVVAKTARVVEEVRVGKEVRDREETIEDTVRRKDVDIERLSANDRTERAVAADKKTLTNKDKPRL